MTMRAARVAGNLPVEVTSFVGRHKAVAKLKQALAQSRLVTLTGVGGVGKSRLALHVAHNLNQSYPDGAWLVEFAKLQDPALVAPAVAACLELQEQSTRDTETVLVDYLANKQLLLVMDNCEHLLEACSRLVTTLLETAPGLRVLATSREPLAIPGEHVWQVPPLSVPAVDQATPAAAAGLQSEALSLFEDRAAAAAPSFQITPDNASLVGQLCRRLDGVPLAIELAAGRVRVLSLAQILSRLEDRFRLLDTGNRTALPRHQTLRAAVDWSFDLCTEQEKLAWTRCSVFAGDFDLDAAEAVCADGDLTRDALFAAVAGLVDKSVLGAEEVGSRVQYCLLETVRQYGKEHLDRSGATDTLRRRHRDYYLLLAEQSDAGCWGPDQPEWSARLRREHANLWVALEYCLTTPGEARTGLRMAGALCFFWMACGYAREGRHWLTRALSIDTTPSRERARALWVAGWITIAQGDNAPGQDLLEQSRDLARQLHDDADLIYATQLLGNAETLVENFSRALPLLDEAIAHHRAARSWRFPAVLALIPRAKASFQLGDVDHAMALLTEGQDIGRAVGAHWALSWLALNLGFLFSITGDTTAAVGQLREALRKKAELHDLLGIPFCIELLACIEVSKDPRKAAVLFGAAERMWQQVGRPLFNHQYMLTWSEQARKRASNALGHQQFDACRLRGARMAQTDVVASALGDELPGDTASAGPAYTVDAMPLTRRELEIATLVENGKSNPEIATSLVISQRTAECHVQHILDKLGFTSRGQITTWVRHQQHTQQ